MSKNTSKFRFKQFDVSHHRSSMKVGVDAVLLGAWTDVAGANRILDVGTGCGLIALMIAQRAPNALINAIDIDAPSVEEALENVKGSPWADRINVSLMAYSDTVSLLDQYDFGFDLIVSNPPYFDSGVAHTLTPREKARHQGELSPLSLLTGAIDLLNPEGCVAMVVPCDILQPLEWQASSLGYTLVRKCIVRGHLSAPYKRALLQWRLGKHEVSGTDPLAAQLTLEEAPGQPSEDYRRLCRDFYLKF